MRLTELKELFLALIVGTIVGLIGTAFHLGVESLQDWQEKFLHLVPNLKIIGDYGWAVSCVLTALAALSAVWLVRCFAPEAGGSGVQEIEGALLGRRPVRWWRVIPVKIAGGLLSLGSGMVMGREGPTIQIGGAIGKLFSMENGQYGERSHILIACGAAAGLTAAFNAPFAGMLFVFEEMRQHFHHNFLSVQCVILATIAADVVLMLLIGSRPEITLPPCSTPDIYSLPWFLVLGLIIGTIGAGFNTFILRGLDLLQGPPGSKRMYFSALIVGAIIGLGVWFWPLAVNGGEAAVDDALLGSFDLHYLFALLAVRLLLTILCYSSGAPGGIFAPLVILGILLGVVFGRYAELLAPWMMPDHIQFGLTGMGALFAATVRAPLTGIALVTEMTGHYELILALIITCSAASITAELCGGKPIYSQLLQRTLKRDSNSS